MDLPEGSLVFFTKDGLKDLKNYLNIALPRIFESGIDWMGYEFQSIFAISISDLDYSLHVILTNLENLCYPFTVAITSTISLKSREKLRKLKPEQLKTYIIISYLFNFLLLIIVILFLLIYGDYYFFIISPNDEIYLKCRKIKYILIYFIFTNNAYYFYLGFLKGFGYIRNTTIATFLVFFGIGPSFIYILTFINKMSVKIIWESTSIALTMGIIFLYWIFSFDLIKIKELAKERIIEDKIYIYRIIYENNNNIRVYINKNIKQEKLIKEQPISVSLENKKKYYFKWKIVYAKYI